MGSWPDADPFTEYIEFGRECTYIGFECPCLPPLCDLELEVR